MVVLCDSHHAVVEGPMAEFAERHAVADVVVFTFAPGNDVGGIHDGVLFRRDDPYPAECATVIVGLDHDASKTLVPGAGLVSVRLQDLLY